MFPKFSDSKTLSDLIGDLRSKIFVRQVDAKAYFEIDRTTIGRYENPDDRMQAPPGYVAALAILLCERENQTSNAAWQNAFLAEINRAFVSVGATEINSWDELTALSEKYLAHLRAQKARAARNNSKSVETAEQTSRGRYLPQKRYRILHGRAHELNQLLKLLSDRRGPPIVFVEGPPGNGKTALARELAERILKRPKWADVLWVSAETMGHFSADGASPPSLTLKGVVQQLSDQAEIKMRGAFQLGEQIQMLRLRFRQRKYLIVLDNLETSAEEETIVHNLYDMVGRSRVLITTRSRNLSRLGLRGIALDGLSPKGIAQYLKREAPNYGLRLDTIKGRTLDRVYESTWGSPLLLSWFLQDARTLSLETTVKSLTARFSDSHDSRERTYAAFFVKRWQNLSTPGKKLWVLLALLIPASVSQKHLEALSPLPLRDFDFAFRELVRGGIVEITMSFSEAEQRVSLHPLVRNFVTHGLKAQRLTPRWLKSFYRGALVNASRSWAAICGQDRKILDKADERRTVLHLTHECLRQKQFNAVVVLYEPVSTDLHTMGYLNEYQEFELDCLAAAKRLGKQKLQAQIQSELGWLALTREQWGTARTLVESALKYYERTNNAFWILVTRRYLATIALDSGEYKAARTQFKALLKQVRQIVATSAEMQKQLDRQEGTIHDSLGIALDELGEYEASERELLLGLKMTQADRPEAAAISHLNLGKMYLHWHKWKLSGTHLEKSFKASHAGHFHRTEAEALKFLSLLADKQRDRKQAIRRARQAQRIYQTLQDTKNAELMAARLKALRGKRA